MAPTALRILYLEDEPVQAEIGRKWLETEGHVVHVFAAGKAALRALERETFDLAVLDWMVPDVSGEEVLRWIRARRPDLRVLFATSNDDEGEIVHILGIGADDYLVKPLRRWEFLARVAALGRRIHRAARDGAIRLGPYEIDPDARTVRMDGEALKVTPRVAALAALLFSRHGQLLSRAHIYEQVWGRQEAPDTRSVDTHVSRLRSALHLDGRHGWKLASVYQHGYRLEECTPSAGAT